MNNDDFKRYMKTNPFASLSDAIQDLLYHEIATNMLKPGDRINVLRISEELGVSRTPVNEACNRLIELNFLETNDQKKGYYVSKLYSMDLDRVLDARKMIETAAVASCMKLYNYKHMKEMYEVAQAFRDYLLSDHQRHNANIKKADETFHDLLIKSSENYYIITAYSNMLSTIRRYQYLSSNFRKTNPNHPYIRVLAHQHITICNAMCSGNVEFAKAAVETHIDATRDMSFFNHDEWSLQTQPE